MATVYIGIGTNLGDKERNIQQAIRLIQDETGTVKTVSSMYRSKPWGFESDNDFLNAVIEVDSSLLPTDLLLKTQEIEQRIGRSVKSTNGYTDRIIDLDILFYDDLMIDTPQLKIPHPLIVERDFVIIPLCEIAPGFIHPVLKKSIRELRDSAGFECE